MSCKMQLSELRYYFLPGVIVTPCFYFLQTPMFKLFDRFPIVPIGIFVLVVIVLVKQLASNLAFNIKGWLFISFLVVIYLLLVAALAIIIIEILDSRNNSNTVTFLTIALILMGATLLLVFLDCLIQSKLSKVSALLKKVSY